MNPSHAVLRHTRGRPTNPDGEGPAIEVRRLSLRYGDQTAFDGIDLTINAGRTMALIGPSGCGKTSFLMALNRLTDLIPQCRISGRIVIGSRDVLAPETDVLALRHRVGMIFQEPNPFPLSIRRNLELPLREHGIRQRARIEAVLESTLRDVGLWQEVKDRLDSPAQTLSGGQQQRLCLARALVLEPEVLLLDEPCSALDPLSSGVVEELIASLRGRYTIVVVTHHLAQARRLADQVAFFWLQKGSGRLIEAGPAEQIFQRPQHHLTAAYLKGEMG